MRLPAILISCALTVAATDRANADPNRIQRVRSGPELADVIDYGITRSPPFEALIERINRSDLILYIEQEGAELTHANLSR